MSCNGCRILRKGCSNNCILRQSLQCIDSPQAQANATLFLAKFFGRAALLSFISNVPMLHRPSLLESLLYEAVGRTINPVTGAVGLLCTGNWTLCQAAVDTVLSGGSFTPILPLEHPPLKRKIDAFEEKGETTLEEFVNDTDGNERGEKKLLSLFF